VLMGEHADRSGTDTTVTVRLGMMGNTVRKVRSHKHTHTTLKYTVCAPEDLSSRSLV